MDCHAYTASSDIFFATWKASANRFPDAIIVMVDANCKGYNERKKLITRALENHPGLQQLVSCAIPDPHIERWMLLDPDAFREVFGRGCTVPAIKCAKDEYKRLLRKEIRQSELDAPLGGVEYAEDIVRAMNLGRVEAQEASLGLFLKDLKSLFRLWKTKD